MTNSIALILDDESDILELISLTLLRMGIDSHCCKTIAEAREALEKKSFDFCLTDLRLPDGDGLSLVEYINQKHSELPVAVITAHGSMDVAIQALKAGAFDFVNKPIELTKLRDLVQTALHIKQQEAELESNAQSPSELLIGQSEAIEVVRRSIKKLAKSMAPVFINGASGTGKELVARMIHLSGPRSKQPFVAVNCGAIPSELMESEFFGHKKGAFTGAVSDKQGLFLAASGGTLFLDEVADLPLNMQVKLLRVLQEKSVRAIGSEVESDVDVRILTATHKNLEQLVEKNEFRQDLFYRINVINLNVPKLSDRPTDIPLIANHILKKLTKEYDIENLILAESSIDLLCQYQFPGNVRELENILERAVTMADDHIINPHDLHIPQNATKNIVSSIPRLSSLRGGSLDTYLMNIEKQLIDQALEQTSGNKTKAAELLGISFRAMRYKLKKIEEESATSDDIENNTD
jgi:two-component system, NtrC family, response regulator PilR